MAKKKSEVRKHTAMMRIDVEALDIARRAASLKRLSLADYCSDLIKKHAMRDLTQEAKKLAGGEGSA